ncbi:MAG TPA: SDR family oxidoreductase [Gaiellaceae bacterium]|jgi:NAD(P)-dependent dehydrogenase (short-subunit alcohol dehydrogenase family)
MTRTALVTGASSGIGEACALRLARGGWRVLACVRRSGDAPSGTEEVLLDVTDDDQVKAVAEQVDELDGLVNNAGIALAVPLEFVPLDELRRQLDVNVIGQVAVTQALLPQLRRSRGKVVFVGSIAGRSALPFLGPYAASKHALEAIADSFRVELQPFGVDVTIVEPGTISTPIWTKSAARAAKLQERLPATLGDLYGRRLTALGRVAQKRGDNGASAADVAKVVESALTAASAPTRVLVGRDAKLRAGIEHLPDRLRDRLYVRVLLR